MAIQIAPYEVLALKKLTLINHALGQQLSDGAAREQSALVQVLNNVTLRADTDNAKKAIPAGLPLSVADWLQERLDNCQRLAAQKKGKDRDGWLQDARYFSEALNALASVNIHEGRDG